MFTPTAAVKSRWSQTVVGEENGAFIGKSFSQEFVQARVEVECVRFQVRNAERNADGLTGIFMNILHRNNTMALSIRHSKYC